MDTGAHNFPVLRIRWGQNDNKTFQAPGFLQLNFFQPAVSRFHWAAEICEIYFFLWVCSLVFFSKKIQLLKMSLFFACFEGRRKKITETLGERQWNAQEGSREKERGHPRKKEKGHIWKMWIGKARLHKQLLPGKKHNTHIFSLIAHT